MRDRAVVTAVELNVSCPNTEHGVRERTGLPVIGIGGIRVADDVKQDLEAGATLVAVGTAFLTDPRCPQRLAAAWRKRG